MNYFVLSVLFAAVLLEASAQLDKEKMKEAAVKLIMDCRTKVGASDADIEAIKMHKLPETKEGLCLLECVFDASGIMKDGKFTKTGMIEGFKPVMGTDQAKLEILNKLAETCEKEVGVGDSDKCQTAKMVVQCVVTNAKNQGFEIPPPHV